MLEAKPKHCVAGAAGQICGLRMPSAEVVTLLSPELLNASMSALTKWHQTFQSCIMSGSAATSSNDSACHA